MIDFLLAWTFQEFLEDALLAVLLPVTVTAWVVAWVAIVNIICACAMDEPL